MSDLITSKELELAPELPPHGPIVWLRNNLFQSVISGVMSILSIILVVFSVKGLLAWLFDEGRRWDAVTYNMKLLMVLAYPADQMWRVWLSLGIVLVLLSVSFAVWRVGGLVEPRHVGRTFMTLGGGIVFVGLVSPFSLTGRLGLIGVGTLFLVVGWYMRSQLGEKGKKPSVSVLGLVTAAFSLLLVAVWTIELPWPEKTADGGQIVVTQSIAMSTRAPWTILFVVCIVSYLVAKFLLSDGSGAKARSVLIGLWSLSFPLIVFVILRDPQVDVTRALTWYLPLFIGFAVVGWFILLFVAKAGKSELARIIGAVLLIGAFASFAFPMEYVFRLLLLTLALFALITPTFGGEGANQKKFLSGWVASALLIVLMSWITLNVSGIDVPGESFLGGLMLTIVLSITSIVISLPIGVLMALGRTSSLPLFRVMSTVYIELVRGVPLITWLIVAFIMLPVAIPENITLTGVIKAIGAMTFFSAAYLAENVRGGLQSVSRGQKEASMSLGMTTLQETVFITLPQALRAVIPALVGQVIALFKDTSLVTIVGLFDFLHIARMVIPAQSNPFLFKGTITLTLIFASAVYWIFTFTFSRVSLRIEKKLGVGER